MARETCSSCDVKLSAPVVFCPGCEQPTRHATEADRLEWDLRTWRAHVDRSVAAGVDPHARTAVAEAPGRPPLTRIWEEPAAAPVPAVNQTAAPQAAPPADRSRPSRGARATVHARKQRVPRRRRERPKPVEVIELDADHEFVYRACATCVETDWIVRTRRNDDETWNYWCVRCSRSFKTEIKLGNALKPFLSAGVVLGGITAASLLMLR
jgi:hypothetical protein